MEGLSFPPLLSRSSLWFPCIRFCYWLKRNLLFLAPMETSGVHYLDHRCDMQSSPLLLYPNLDLFRRTPSLLRKTSRHLFTRHRIAKSTVVSYFFILVQLVLFLPMALVRNLAKLSTAALVADVFILAGLLYIFGSELSIIGERGIAEIQLFNPRDFPLFVGTAVFSFEGIGLVIPITDAMREPHKFPKALTGVMLGTLVLFGGAGALAYLTFGSDVNAVVLVNLDQKSKFTQAVQFLYSLAILLSIPLQFFPAVRILENGLFVRSGKRNPRVKWLKNFFRFGLVMVCTVVSWLGAADLDKFVSLIGSFACIPLCFVYPAMLHYKAVAKTPREKIIDIVLVVFGMAAMVFTTVQTIKLMAQPEPLPAPPTKC